VETLAKALAAGKETLKQAGIDSYSLDASLLLSSIAGLSRSSLLARPDLTLTLEQTATYQTLVNRRAAHEPIAYLLGQKEFYGLNFKVTPATLIPRPDTELLIDLASAAIASSQKPLPELRLLDLCTGSGAIAVTMKHLYPSLQVTATDISPEALHIASTNALTLLGSSNSITFHESDLFTFSSTDLFDIILSNPPYVPAPDISHLQKDLSYEPLLALDGGPDGLDIITRLIAEAPSHLTPNGLIFIEADSAQMPAIRELLSAASFTNITVHKDLSSQDRVIQARHIRD
jgi:release factor glutamine methyltransferase